MPEVVELAPGGGRRAEQVAGEVVEVDRLLDHLAAAAIPVAPPRRMQVVAAVRGLEQGRPAGAAVGDGGGEAAHR